MVTMTAQQEKEEEKEEHHHHHHHHPNGSSSSSNIVFGNCNSTIDGSRANSTTRNSGWKKKQKQQQQQHRDRGRGRGRLERNQKSGGRGRGGGSNIRSNSLSVVSFLAISVILSFIGTITQIWIWTLQQRSLSMLSSIINDADNDNDSKNHETNYASPEPLLQTQVVKYQANVTTPSIPTSSTNNDDSNSSSNKGTRRVIFVISMGITASKTHFVERFVYSARTRGQYDGWIVLLTDAPATRYQKLQQWNYHNNDDDYLDKSGNNTTKQAGKQNGKGDEKFIIIHPKPEHYNSQFKRKDMTIKRFKTYVIDYIDMLSSSSGTEDGANSTATATTRTMITSNNDWFYKEFQKVDLIYYLDVDIVFSGPLSTVFDGLEQKYKIGSSGSSHDTNTNTTNAVWTTPIPHRSKIWMFEGNFKNAPIQGGQMVLDRRQSLGCLEKWRNMIDKGAPNVKKDQLPLMGMYHSQLGRMNFNKNKKKKKKKRKGMQQTSKNETKYLEPLDCFIVKMDQKPYISFPEKEDVENRAKELSSSSPLPSSTASDNNGSTSTDTSRTTGSSSSFLDSVSHHKRKYTNMVHVRNTAGVGMHLEDKTHKIWLRDVLDMKPNNVAGGDDDDEDPLGILEPGHMKARRNDQVAATSS